MLRNTTEPKAQTIEQVKMDSLKGAHRYQIALVAFVMFVAGVIGGYFLAINIITDSQSKAISVMKQTSPKE